MNKAAIPTFEQWVDYCFTKGLKEFRSGAEPIDAESFDSLPPAIVAEYFLRLAQKPRPLAERYSDQQISDAVWFIFGVGSCYFHDMRSKDLPQSTQIECISAVARMYRELFDEVCCQRGQAPDEDFTNTSPVDIAVYMIWDMDCIEGAARDESCPHLIGPTFSVLNDVLNRCKTSTCQISALHGLGHLHSYHPLRATQIIDQFLNDQFRKRQRCPSWVIDYAKRAREGGVQ